MAPFLYALAGALIGGLVIFVCLQLWARQRSGHKRFNSTLSSPAVHVVEHPSLPTERKWQVQVLTPREMEIAQLAAAGKRTADIARELYISPYTVETHLKNIYKKIGVSSRLELARALEMLGSSEG